MAATRDDGRPRQRRRWEQRASAVRAWLRRRQALVDVLVVVLFAAMAVGRISADHGPVPASVWILAFAGFVPLGFRRRAPVAVFAAVTTTAVVALAVGSEQAAPMLVVAQLAALYFLAASRPRPLALGCAAVFELWAVVALFVWVPHGLYLPSILLMTGTALAALMTGINHQTRRAYLAALEDRAARLERERDQQARLAVAQERTRIAREVHDIVSHSLSVMVALADGAAAVNATAPDRAAEAMGQTARTGRDAIGEMRRMLGTLRTDEPAADRHPQPGIAELDALLDQVRAAGLPSRLTVEGGLGHLPVGAQLAVYRIVQESLTNIRKHADGASAAWVRLTRSDGTIHVEVTDDGRARGMLASVPGHGIAGMRERAAAYGGSVEAGPGPRGWRVHAWMHLDQKEEPR
jgi:signal transduction histidine kinase